jgi:O-antigen/teichoic acid export membrane protein
MSRAGVPDCISPFTARGCDRVLHMRRFVFILGIVLLVLGVIGLVHPTFNYHRQEEVVKIGSIKATMDEQKTAQIPPALSITLLVAGIGLVLLGPRMKP